MGYQIAIVVDWYGPYSTIKEARSAARKDYGEGIYMLIGLKKYQKEKKMQYMGVANDIAARLSNRHEKAQILS